MYGENLIHRHKYMFLFDSVNSGCAFSSGSLHIGSQILNYFICMSKYCIWDVYLHIVLFLFAKLLSLVNEYPTKVQGFIYSRNQVSTFVY
jgi:hypothetical protein